MVLELASLEKKEERRKKERKKMTIFDFFKVHFLASIKLSGNQRTYLYSGGSGLSIDIHFVDIELSYDVLSPLPIVLSKHFNHPHPYIEIATAISDIWSVGWDTNLHTVTHLKSIHDILTYTSSGSCCECHVRSTWWYKCSNLSKSAK